MTSSPAFRIRALRLVGPSRSYRVNFTDKNDPETIRALSVIAGEISTGKTTVLEFIDWCLGAKEHPEHDEVLANVRSAQLSIDLPSLDAQDRRHVIERALGARSTRAFLYQGDLDSMSNSPVRSFSYDPADPESLSYYLLQLCGLSGLRLDQSPTQEESKTSILSFRDVQPLWFLTNRRMDNGNLAFEGQPYRSIKLNQVFDILFGVTDNEHSALSRAAEELGTEERELSRAVHTLRIFMADAGIHDLEELDAESDKLRVHAASLSAGIQAIDGKIAARSGFTAELQSAFASAQQEVQKLQARLRDRETLVSRLEPLRAQYADEIRRLDLVSESISLFDSLAVTICPACQNKLKIIPSVEDNICTLCSSDLSIHKEDEVAPDLSKEHRSLTRRLNQLLEFSQEVRAECDQLRSSIRSAKVGVENAQSELDGASSQVISPYLFERDHIQRVLTDTSVKLKTLERTRQMLLQLQQKETELLQVSAAFKEAKARRTRYLQKANPRDSVLENIGERLHSILIDFGYPKIDRVHIEKNLVPYVRGRRYDKVGSSGAMTLIALAWELALFELAFEQGSGHPGFLVVDSPQKNLMPGLSPTVPSSEGKELSALIAARRSSIVENIYLHVESWLNDHPGAQIIFVDNLPPSEAIRHIVVRYSQQPEYPPYGLIENEDGNNTASDG